MGRRCPLFPWPGALPLDLARDFPPFPHYRALHLYLEEGLQLSSAGTDVVNTHGRKPAKIKVIVCTCLDLEHSKK